MNLIEQLQQYPKWKEFEEWYEKNLSVPPKSCYEIEYHIGFEDLPFEFQKGVFEKFIESFSAIVLREENLHERKIQYRLLKYLELGLFTKKFNSFDELLIWYFNN